MSPDGAVAVAFPVLRNAMATGFTKPLAAGRRFVDFTPWPPRMNPLLRPNYPI